MSNLKEELLKEIASSVVDMEEEKTIENCKLFLESGFGAYEGIDKGLASGMRRVGQLYDEEEYYIPELLICSDAMYAGIEVLKPHLKSKANDEKHKVVIGVMEGDTHDIGKNLVKIMMETEGFYVEDLGRDVPAVKFVEKAKEIGAHIICMSTLMTTTMGGMEKVIEILEEQNLRGKIKVMIGGGPVSNSFAQRIGADAYTTDASKAAKMAKEMLEI